MTVDGDPGRAVTYGELIGDKQFNVKITGQGTAEAPSPITSSSAPTCRASMSRHKVSGKYAHMQHVRVPNMLHGRVVRPRGQGAYGALAPSSSSIDERSIADIPGARVVRKGDFVGVVAEREWDAMRPQRSSK